MLLGRSLNLRPLPTQYLIERETDTMEGGRVVTKEPEGGVMKARGGKREVVEERRREEGGKPSSSPEEFWTPPSSLKEEEEEQNMEVDESGQKWGGDSFSEEDQHWGQPQVREG